MMTYQKLVPAGLRADFSTGATSPADPRLIAGLREYPYGSLYTGAITGFYKNAWSDYLNRRDGPAPFSTHLDKCLTAPQSCSLSLQAFSAIITEANTFPGYMKHLRLAFLNTMVNRLVTYDREKAPLRAAAFNWFASAGKGWIPPPQEILKGAEVKGTCGDITALKYEAALRCGFEAKDLKIVGTTSHNLKYHIALSAHAEGTNYILDMQRRAMFEGIAVKGPSHLMTDRNLIDGYVLHHQGQKLKFSPMRPFIAMTETGASILGGKASRNPAAEIDSALSHYFELVETELTRLLRPGQRPERTASPV